MTTTSAYLAVRTGLLKMVRAAKTVANYLVVVVKPKLTGVTLPLLRALTRTRIAHAMREARVSTRKLTQTLALALLVVLSPTITAITASVVPYGNRLAELTEDVNQIFNLEGSADAAAGIRETFHFQARLLTAAGDVVPDGNYNVQFKIYQDGDGDLGGGDEVEQWSEDWLNNDSNGIRVVNGYVSAELGSITAFGSSVDWNQDTLWLSVNIGNTNGTCTPFSSCAGDGELDPFFRLTAVPYALNAGELGGRSADQFVQLDPGATPQAVSTTNSAIAVNQQGTGNLLQLQDGGSDVLVVEDGGAATLTGTLTVSSTTTLQSTLSVTDDLTVDTNTLFVDASEDKVGIGTTTGLNTLTVEGSTIIDGTGTETLTGSIDPNGTAVVTGSGTQFLTEIFAGDKLTVSGETRTVTEVLDNTTLFVDAVFSDNANDTSPDRVAASLIVRNSADETDFVLNSDGFVGLGTVDPEATFHLTDTVGGQTDPIFRINTTSNDNKPFGLVYIEATNAANPSALFNLNQFGTGDIIRAHDSGTRVVTVTDEGYWTVQNSGDSTTAYRIQDAGGDNVFTVDTTNGEVELGDSDQAGELVINDGTANTLGIQSGAQSQDTVVSFPDVAAASDTICLVNAGNCGVAGLDLQGAYDNGNDITTSDARDLDLLLADTATDSNFDIDIAADNLVSISRLDNAVTESPSQLLLIENLDTDLVVNNGIAITSAAGTIIDAIDATDGDITNALNIGGNNIVGTTGNIDLDNFDVVGATGNTTVGGTLTVTGLGTFNGGLTVETGDTFTVNGDGFTDLTGDGLELDGSSLSVDDTSTTGFIRNGGNTLGAGIVIGSDDSNTVILETNDTTALTIDTSQNVTIAGDLGVNGGDFTTNQTTFNLLNGTATTVNFAGAATTLSLGAATGTSTVNNDLAVDGGDITSSQATFNLLNTTPTTLNFAGAATTLSIGAGTGTTTVNNDLAVNGGDFTTNQTTFNLVNTTATTLNIGGAATALSLGAGTGTTTVNNSLTVSGSTFTFNGDGITDLTGDGLELDGAALSVDDTSATGFFRNGGNSFAGAATLGTEDTNVLNLETDGTTAVTIDTSQNVGIGDATPDANTEISANGATGGNIFLLSSDDDNDGDILTVSEAGEFALGAITNSTDTLVVQNAANVNLLRVDTFTTTNNINNGGVEVDTTGWATKASSAIARNTSNAFEGDASLAITADASNEGAEFAYTFTASTQYTLTLYAKADSGFSTFNIGRQDNGADIDCLTGQTVTSSGWTRFSCTFTTGGTISGSNIYIKQTDGTSRTIYIDGVSLEEASTAGPFQNGLVEINGVLNQPLFVQNQEDSTNAVTVQNAADAVVFRVDTENEYVAFGDPTRSTGAVRLYNAANNNYADLVINSYDQNTTITFPNPSVANESVCLLSLGNCFGSGTGNNLQAAYDAGNSIATTSARDIDFTLTNSASDADFVVTVDDGSTGTVRIEREDGIGTSDPAQLLLLDNLDTDRSIAAGLTIQSAAGGITNGIDVSDAELTNGVNLGANILAGGAAVIDFDEFDVSATGVITSGSADQAGSIVLFDSDTGSETVTINGGATTSSYSLTLPTSLGSSGFCLRDSDGAGTLIFSDCGVGATVTLQNAYTFGNNITTTDADNGIEFDLADTTDDENFEVDIQGTGNQIIFADGGNAVFTVNDGGSVDFRTEVDIQTGFQVLDNDEGTPILNVDTLNERVGIGTGAPNGALQVVGDEVRIGDGGTIDIAAGDGDIYIENAAEIDGTLDVAGTATFTTDADFTLADTENVTFTNTVTGTSAVDLLSGVLTNNTSSGTQRAALLQNAAGSGTTEAILALDNADTDTAVTDGLIVTSAAGTITDGIDVSDTDIVNALNVGANVILGTGGATINFDNFDVDASGNVTAIDVAVNGGDLTSTQATMNVFNATPTTLNIGGAATAISLGAGTGTTTVNNDVSVNGGDLVTNQTTFNLINTTATTLNIGGAATALEIGAATGTTSVNNALAIDGLITANTLGTADNTSYVCLNSSSQLASCNTTGTGVAFVQGGNDFGETAVLGTNDDFGLQLEVGGVVAATIADEGAVTLQNEVNSTGAFQVQDSGSNSIFRIDTENGFVSINDATPAAALDVDADTSSTTADTFYGQLLNVVDDGIVTTGTDTTEGIQLVVSRTGATGGTINTRGLDLNVTGDTGGTSTAIGLDIDVQGADSNYAAIFRNGRVGIGDTTPDDSLLEVDGTVDDSNGAQLLFVDAVLESGTNSQEAVQIDAEYEPTGSDAGSVLPTALQIDLNSASTFIGSADLQAVEANVEFSGAGDTIGNITSVLGNATVSGSANASILRGLYSQVTNSSSGVVARADGLNIQSANNSGGGSITDNYGIFVGNQTAGDNDYGIYVQGADTYALFVDAGDTRLDGDLDVRGGDLTTDQTTFNLLDTTATTINLGGAATTLSLGAGTGTTTVNNALDVTGATTLNGTVDLGNETGDTVTFNGYVGSSIIPDTNDSYDFGLTGARWQDLFLSAGGAINIGTAAGDEYTIAYDTTNNTLEVQAGVDAVEGFQVLDVDGGNAVLNVDTLNERVGINTNAPGARLEVGAGSGTDVSVRVNGGTSTGNILEIEDGGTDVFTIADGGGVVFQNVTNSTAAFQINNAGDASTIFEIDTTNNQVKIGDDTAASSADATVFTLDSATTANQPTGVVGSLYYDTTLGRIQCYESDGWGACGAPPDNIVTITPEYSGAVLNGTGVGTMSADFCADQTGILEINTSLCGAGEALNYYQWTSPQATPQTYSILLTYQLPSTFDEFQDNNTITLTARSDNLTDGTVTYEVFRNSGVSITECGSDTTVTSTVNTWQTVSHNGDEQSVCGFTASDSVIFKINMTADSNANVYVGDINFTFINE